MSTTATNISSMSEESIAEFLECYYSNGSVLLAEDQIRKRLAVAMLYGFIDQEEYLTRKGSILLARYY
ncbi:hypothetical protein SPBRAN_1215 [uncultured Candidatus Thioglobus sp.]|nr:hypothetical protein SPBRAN_1215 [uncultured Candidatus Thioglobus sp.]